MSAVVIEMSQMSDSKELYHSKPPAACVAFLYTTFILCIMCLMWICTGRINIIIEGNATIVTLQKQNTRQLENEKEYWIQMLVSSCEIQWVEPGMTIRCSMEALPASEYGFVEGHITEVSSQLYIDSKGQGYYLVTARLDSTTLTGSSGRIAALQEQMFGKAKILAGTQSVLHYLQNHVK